MKIALNPNNQLIEASELDKGYARSNDYRCVECQELLIFVSSSKRAIAHFRHEKESICIMEDKIRCQNIEGERLSKFHRTWQQIFPKEYLEVPVIKDNKKHIADILIGLQTEFNLTDAANIKLFTNPINRLTIEIQHSSISKEMMLSRENNYCGNNSGLIWIFDVSESDSVIEVIKTYVGTKMRIRYRSGKSSFMNLLTNANKMRRIILDYGTEYLYMLKHDINVDHDYLESTIIKREDFLAQISKLINVNLKWPDKMKVDDIKLYDYKDVMSKLSGKISLNNITDIGKTFHMIEQMPFKYFRNELYWENSYGFLYVGKILSKLSNKNNEVKKLWIKWVRRHKSEFKDKSPYKQDEGINIGDLSDERIQWLSGNANIKSRELIEKIDMLHHMTISRLIREWGNSSEEYSLDKLIYANTCVNKYIERVRSLGNGEASKNNQEHKINSNIITFTYLRYKKKYKHVKSWELSKFYQTWQNVFSGKCQNIIDTDNNYLAYISIDSESNFNIKDVINESLFIQPIKKLIIEIHQSQPINICRDYDGRNQSIYIFNIDNSDFILETIKTYMGIKFRRRYKSAENKFNDLLSTNHQLSKIFLDSGSEYLYVLTGYYPFDNTYSECTLIQRESFLAQIGKIIGTDLKWPSKISEDNVEFYDYNDIISKLQDKISSKELNDIKRAFYLIEELPTNYFGKHSMWISGYGFVDIGKILLKLSKGDVEIVKIWLKWLNRYKYEINHILQREKYECARFRGLPDEYTKSLAETHEFETTKILCDMGTFLKNDMQEPALYSINILDSLVNRHKRANNKKRLTVLSLDDEINSERLEKSIMSLLNCRQISKQIKESNLNQS